ncbi:MULTISPECIES: Ldh family oxidoreductase [Streptomyces]|uniref:Ldh family oxidoreductase n=1 Tax=Streptomyces flavotricini TaxID=66888 RepID=A0ABS8EGE8_9ACTN|nr:Ldh family oxidoreductase [Streptomyces flavotricini]MCC0100225.1 Ldh family oxidoreductase [Streptomyces flavotricini]
MTSAPEQHHEGWRRLIDAAELTRFTTEALRAAGARHDDAVVTAEVLVAADLGGVDSHGVARLRRYVEGLHGGDINRNAVPEIISDKGSVCVLDAHNGLGQPALRTAVDLAVDRASRIGTSAVMVRRSNHMGIAGWFAERAARAGMLAMVSTNAVPQVAPMGTNEPMFGTNPFCYAVPTARGTLCFDGATSTVSRGKLEQLDRLGKPMPTGWALGPDGRPTTDIPETVQGLIHRKGYALLPLGGGDKDHGGHKGSALALFIELLCGPLAGAQWSRHTYQGGEGGLGHFVFCIGLDALGDPEVIRAGVDRLAQEVRDGTPADPQDRVRLPGDRRGALTAARQAHGIPVLESVVADLDDIAAFVGIAPVRALTYET